MNEKSILLVEAKSDNKGFNQRLRKALEKLNCDVAVCDARNTTQLLSLLDEKRLPVVLK